MLEMAPDPKEMIGGGMSASAAAMEYLLQQTSSQNNQARKVLAWLRTGMKFEFVGTDHASQEKALHRKRTLEVVRKMLQRVVGKDRVEEYLSSQTPLKVQFPQIHKTTNQCRSTLSLWKRNWKRQEQKESLLTGHLRSLLR